MEIIVKDNAGVLLNGVFYKVDSGRNQTGAQMQFRNGIASFFPENENDLYFFTAPGYASFVSDVASLEDNNTVELFKSENSNLLYLAIGSGVVLLLAKNKKNNKKALIAKVDTDKIMPLIYIGGGLIAFSAIKKILTTFGIIDSQDTTDLNNQATNPASPWNPGYYKKFSSYSYVIDYNTAVSLIDQITSAFGMFNDNEEQAIGVFKQLKTKSNLSYLADVFYRVKGEDLLTYLRGGIWPQDRLSDYDVNQINSYIQNLPTN